MSPQRLEISQEFSRPVEDVFAILSDHNQLAKVLGGPVKRIKDGQGDVNGVGSVRAIGIGPLALEETVVAVIPNETIEYTITKNGGPIRNHYGRLLFSKTATGSRVDWIITYDSLPILGSVIGKTLKFVLGRGLRTLA